MLFFIVFDSLVFWSSKKSNMKVYFINRKEKAESIYINHSNYCCCHLHAKTNFELKSKGSLEKNAFTLNSQIIFDCNPKWNIFFVIDFDILQIPFTRRRKKWIEMKKWKYLNQCDRQNNNILIIDKFHQNAACFQLNILINEQ